MKPDQILRLHDLKSTACRKFIVKTLSDADCRALSEQEMKASSSGFFDRITFYRTLKTLEEHGLIHRIVLPDATVKYALSNHSEGTVSQRGHAHFHCVKCDSVVCVKERAAFDVVLPKGYVSTKTSVVIDGFCHHCSEKQ